jgi:hypothetical protein
VLLTWQFRYAPPPGVEAKAPWVLQFRPYQYVPGQRAKLRVEAERPVLSAARLLSTRFNGVITYEESLYQCPCNLVGVLKSSRLGLAGGIVRVGWDRSDEPLGTMLEALMGAPVEPRDPGGMFQVEPTSVGYRIYPRLRRAEDGALEAAVPLLDQKVVMRPTGPTPVRSVLADVAGAVSRSGGRVVPALSREDVGGVRIDVAEGLHGDAVEAREILDAVVKRLGPGYTWNLLYAAEEEVYYLRVEGPEARSAG